MKETLEKKRKKGETKLKTPHKQGRKETKQKRLFVQSFVLFPHP